MDYPDINPVVSAHVESIVLLSKLKSDKHIDVELDMGELDLTAAESKATYAELKQYVLDKYGLKISSLNIAKIKAKCGIIKRENYNKAKNENVKQPNCTKEKENAIKDAFKHLINDIRFKGKRSVNWDDVEMYLRNYVGDYYKGPKQDYDPNRPGDIWEFKKNIDGIQFYVKVKIIQENGKDILKCIGFHEDDFA